MKRKKILNIVGAAILTTGFLSTLAYSVSTKSTIQEYKEVAAADYYSGISDSMNGTTLLSALNDIIDNNGVSVSYDWSRYEAADEDPNNSNNVLLVYARTSVSKSAHVSGNTGWNREHSFPQSKMESSQAKSDNHIIFASDNKVNGARGNLKMGVVSGGEVVQDYNGHNTTCRKTSSLFDPNNEARGIVARSTMYAAAMYNFDPTDNFESIATMLSWHLEYPVSSFDVKRNDTVYSNQHNRNPFVDHPEYACKIWGDTNSTTRNICGMSGSTPTVTSVTVSPSSLALNLANNTTGNLSATVNGTNSPSQGVTWSSSNNSVTTVTSSGVVTAVAAGTSTITATSTADNTKYGTCLVTVSDGSSQGGGGSGETTYTLITSNNSLSNGDKVVLKTEGSPIKGVSGYNGNKDANVSETESDWIQFVVGSATSSGFTLYDEDYGSYIASPSGNEFKYSASSGTCSVDLSGHIVCNSRFLCVNGTNYRFYTAIGSYTPFLVYRVDTGSGVDEPTVTKIEVSNPKTEYEVGDEFEEPTVIATFSDASTDEVTEACTFTGYDMSTAGDYTVTVTFIDAGITETTTYDITVVDNSTPEPIVTGSTFSANGDYYVRINSTDDLSDGDYLIVYETGNVAFDGSLSSLDAVSNTISVSITNNTIASSQSVDASAFTYNSTDKTLKSKSGYYIGREANSNGLNSSTSTKYTNTITFSENNVLISSGTTVLKYNNASNQNRFRYYTSGQQSIQLYKKTVSWGTYFLSTITCDGGTTAPSKTNWATVKAAYDSMSTSEQTKVKAATANQSGTDLQKAVARYVFIINKYNKNTTTYTDYLNKGSSSNNIHVIDSSNATGIIIICVSIVSISSFAICMMFRKKKEQ